ncbi:MAG: hypothetical protein J6K58_12555 [Lachnospiraceae bacterium]|nr:hypothetical protein [Lachnospiraceae bacterium]
MKKRNAIMHLGRGLLMVFLIGALWLWKGAVEAEAYNFSMTGAARGGTVTIVPAYGNLQVNGFHDLGGYEVTYTISGVTWNAFDNSLGGYFYMGNQLNVSGGCSFGYHHSGGMIWEDGAICLGSMPDGQQIIRCDADSGTVSCTFRINSLEELPAYIAYGYQPAPSAYLHISDEYGDRFHIWYYQELGNVPVSNMSKVDITGPSLEVSAVPVGNTVQVKGKTWSQKAAVKAVAGDDQSGPGGIRFFQNGMLLKEQTNNGSASSMEADYQVVENGTFQMQAYDRLKNESDLKSVTVSCIDTQAPVMNSLETAEKEWCRENQITVDAHDTGCGLAALPFSWNDGPWTADRELKIKENGTYTLKVRDALGNQISKSVKVNNIDNKPPVIQYKQKQNGKTANVGGIIWSTEASLEVTVLDTCSGIKQIKVLDPMGEVIKIWENRDGKEKTSVIFETPGLEREAYEIIAEDMTGNGSKESTGRLFVDRNPPVIQKFQAEKTEDGTVRIVVTAEDNEGGCGLAQKPYSFDGGKTWQAEPYTVIEQNGIYQVAVRDALDQCSKASLKADLIREKEEEDKDDSEKGGNEQTVSSNDDSAGKDTPEEKDGRNSVDTGNGKETGSSGEVRKSKIASLVKGAMEKSKNFRPSVQRKTIMAEETLEKPEEDQVKELKPEVYEGKEPVQKGILAVLLLLFAAGLVGLILYLFLSWLRYSCVVYGIGEKEEKIRLCRLPVCRQDEEWQIKVPDNKLGTHGTGKYLFVFHPSFIKEEAPGFVMVYLDGKALREQLEEEISVSI